MDTRLGSCRMEDGTHYAGELIGTDLPEGVGVGKTADGHMYAGQWLGGCRDGVGCYMLATGGTYWGQFKANKMEGAGVYLWSDGSSYKGQFAGDVWHGSALYITNKGTQWFVQYECGKRLSCIKFHGTGEQAGVVLKAEEARVSPCLTTAEYCLR